jgi:hypothetical protein
MGRTPSAAQPLPTHDLLARCLAARSELAQTILYLSEIATPPPATHLRFLTESQRTK